MPAPNLSWKRSNPAAMRLILKPLIVSGTTLHYITTAFPSSCPTFLCTIRSLWRVGVCDCWKTYMPWRAKDIWLRIMVLPITFALVLMIKCKFSPPKVIHNELLVQRLQTTHLLPLLVGEDFVDIHAYWNVTVPIACDSITCFGNTFSTLFKICPLLWGTPNMYVACNMNRHGTEIISFTNLELR